MDAFLPILVTVGALLVALGLVVFALHAIGSHRIEGFFRRPPKAPKTPGKDHYYKPYWQG